MPADKRRWILVKRPLPRKEALARRAEDIRWKRDELENRREELRHLRLAPLIKFTQEYVPVLPGDPRYEKADFMVDPISIHGAWSFTTTKTNLCHPHQSPHP